MSAKEPSTAELLLHPVRWRVVQALMGRHLTTADLSRQLPDVATTTLYRHVGLLAKAGVVVVVEEQRIRGTVERTYALADPTGLEEQEVASMDRDQHRQAFLQFTTGLLATFDRYLAREEIDPVNDFLNYNQAALYVTEEDIQHVGQALTELLTPYLEQRADVEQRRLMLATILVPSE